MTAAIAFDDLAPAPPRLDHEAIEQARLVRLARQHLATREPSVDYDGLARGRDSTVLAARQWVKRQRAKGQVFVVDYDSTTLIPSFQLDEVFNLDNRVGPVVQRLSEAGLNGWAIWQWFTAFNPWVEARPVDLIGSPELDLAVDGLMRG